jgi:two-component system, sensor histidine kinase RegB
MRPFRDTLRNWWDSGPFVLGQQVGSSGWLYQLRWFAVIGQLVTLSGAALFYRVNLPLPELIGLAAFTAATNLLYGYWLRRRHRDPSPELRPQIEAVVMLVDLLVLSAMLYLTGGSSNPFAAFVLVNLAVGCVILRPAWAWTLTGLAVLGYALLTYQHRVLPELELPSLATAEPYILLHGRVVSFSTCAMVVTFFVSRLSNELMSRQEALRVAEQQRDRSQRLEALATLAAGAAHELASPLSTIAVVAREMSRHLEQVDPDGAIRKDVKLIDGELDHCRQILNRMRSHAGDSSAESWGRATLGELLDAILEGVREPSRIEVTVTDTDEEALLWLPVETIAQVIRNVLHNALDASRLGNFVVLTATIESPWCQLRVQDQGDGMSEETLRRLGEWGWDCS